MAADCQPSPQLTLSGATEVTPHSTLSSETVANFPLHSTRSGATESQHNIDSATLYIEKGQLSSPRTLLYLVQLNSIASATLYLASRKPIFRCTLLPLA
jgi:hypothetical protein